MNKKIFTLLAAGLMGGLSVSAAPANYTKGNLHQLTVTQDGLTKVISVGRTYNNSADSLIAVDAPAAADYMKDSYKKTLWKITESNVDNTQSVVYTFTNHATGTVLSLDLAKGTGTIAAGQSAWLFEGSTISAIKNGETYNLGVKTVTITVNGQEVQHLKVQVGKSVAAGAFSLSQPTAIQAMAPEQINGLYGTASVFKFTKTLEGNPIDGVPFTAKASETDGYVNLRLSTGKYLVVDTTVWTNSVNDFNYWKLTTDALPTGENRYAAADAVKGGATDVLVNGRKEDTYKFQVSLDIAKGYVMTIKPYAVPKLRDGVSNDDKKQLFCYDSEATARPLLYGKFASSANVLTATKSSPDQLQPATASFGATTTPSELSKDYVYYVQDYRTYNVAGTKKNADYKKYAYINECGDFDAINKAKTSVAVPSYMWYLSDTGLSNMIVEPDAEYEEGESEPAYFGPITLVDEENSIYDFNGDTLKLTKGPKLTDAQKMGFKQVTKADEVNGALSFRLVSSLADDLYIVAKSNKMYVANSELADAMKFKVVAAESEGEDYETVGNGVIVPKYYLTNRLGNKYLVLDDDENFVWEAPTQDPDDEDAEILPEGAVVVSFFSMGANDQYKIVLCEEAMAVGMQAVTANAASGILQTGFVCDTKNVVFEFAKKDAPMFGAPAFGHVQITTLEDDNKMIAPQLDGFAALKAEGQILKSDVYTNDTLKLWLDTALVDDVMPLYYLSSSAFNEEGDLRNYLINPANISKAIIAYNEEADDEDKIEDIFPFTSIDGTYRAAFTPASEDEHKCLVLEGDTISTIEFNPAAIAFEVAAEISDEAYYIVSNLKSVNEDYDADDEESLPYNEEDASWYLAQLNNVLFWTDDASKAEVFVINRTTAPTANEAVEAETVKVIGGQGVVTVQGAAGKVITVANILGQTIANQVAASDNVTIAAPAGVVVVSVDGEATKVVVK